MLSICYALSLWILSRFLNNDEELGILSYLSAGILISLLCDTLLFIVLLPLIYRWFL